MPTIQLQADVSPADLLRAVDQLDAAELEKFVFEILAMRAKRQSPCLTSAEADLLQRINQGLPADQDALYRELVTKRQAQTLTPDEHVTLLQLTDQAELREANRAAALIELARRRRVSVDELMCDLGIHPPSNG
jgi:hypothetical protein